jgi:hypothetical protein
MALWKSILNVIANRLIVPSVNSALNDYMQHVIGNKLDDESGNSLYSKNYLEETHIHNNIFLFPELADCIELTKASGIWADFPTPTEIIPANAVTAPFDLHFMNISEISADGQYVIALYKGAPGSEERIGIFGAARTAVLSQEGSRNIITPVIPANTRISAALSSENSAQNTLCLKLEGHPY